MYQKIFFISKNNIYIIEKMLEKFLLDKNNVDLLNKSFKLNNKVLLELKLMNHVVELDLERMFKELQNYTKSLQTFYKEKLKKK